MKAERQQVERLARRLDIPCFDNKWLIDSIVQGHAPEGYQGHSHLGKRTHSNAFNTKTESVNEQANSVHKTGGCPDDNDYVENKRKLQKKKGTTVQECNRADCIVDIVIQDSIADEATKKQCIPTSSQPHSKQLQQQKQQEEEETHGQTRALISLQSNQAAPCATALNNSVIISNSMNLSAASSISVSWEGDPQAPPEGFLKSNYRSYYAAAKITINTSGTLFTNDASSTLLTIEIGSFVELLPELGESIPRVGQIKALWSEKTRDGSEKPYCSVRRFFKPEELPPGLMFTSLMNQKGTKPVLISDCIEDKVSLGAVMSLCDVRVPGSIADLNAMLHADGWKDNSGGGDHQHYVCCMLYDDKNEVIRSMNF